MSVRIYFFIHLWKEFYFRFIFLRTVISQAGEYISQVCDADGTEHFVRLLTYLPGRVFAEVNPHTNEFLRDFGSFIGSISNVLSSFDHPATHRDFYWDMKNSPTIISEYRDLIEDSENRELVDYFYELFDEKVVQKICNLRTSANHNDANDYNVLVQNSWDDEARRFGLLDFGDMVYTCTVFELAVATAYAMLGKPDPLSAAASVVQGYHETHHLTELEIELKRAKNEIEQLKEQLRKRDITIMELQEENIDLRKLTRKGLAE